MRRAHTLPLFLALALALQACGAGPRVERVEEEEAALSYEQFQIPGPKRRVAIAEFTDKTGYGNNLFGRVDDLGKQASDILASHLIKTDEFIVLERQQLDRLMREQEIGGASEVELGKGLIGVDALIFGSVTEFGVKTTGEERLFTKSRVQQAHCKVTIRLVDPQTGHAFYSEFGEADAALSVDSVMGFGGRASYDATLADKALNGAVVKLLGNMINTLGQRPWTGRILDIQGEQVFVNAGARIGLSVGDILVVERPGKQVRNPQTSALIRLPGVEAARLRVVTQFGSTELDEGSICEIVSGGGIELSDTIRLPHSR